MSFQAYIDNIRKATGKSPGEFRVAASEAGLSGKDVTATRFVAWLAADFGLGRGHAMALWAIAKKESWFDPAAGKMQTSSARSPASEKKSSTARGKKK